MYKKERITFSGTACLFPGYNRYDKVAFTEAEGKSDKLFPETDNMRVNLL